MEGDDEPDHLSGRGAEKPYCSQAAASEATVEARSAGQRWPGWNWVEASQLDMATNLREKERDGPWSC